MKKTGMTRPVDELGRVVIPKEIRNSLQIEVKDRLEILLDGDAIVLK
ncbi:MAG: AbrB/MazE/SpoVT family DNA-binding domain-containing protein, partial [Clostridia bacterium]|nr:AbrB/MazE/SpoVT family DNA-binding domain-containing protein [Clostridia bacterium]